jgi:hypothetical protein
MDDSETLSTVVIIGKGIGLAMNGRSESFSQY